jgi:hypothetical protein
MIDFGPIPLPIIPNKITTVVGGVNGTPLGGPTGVSYPANGTDIGNPYGLALDEQTNTIYFEGYNMYVYNATYGTIYHISLNGNTAEEACAFDPEKKQLYCTRGANRQMYKQSVVSPYTTGIILNTNQDVNPPYDGGPADIAPAKFPYGVAYDNKTKELFLSGTYIPLF